METDDKNIGDVTAMTVNPSGTRLACYGRVSYGVNGYLFMLDTSNGAIVSGLMKVITQSF